MWETHARSKSPMNSGYCYRAEVSPPPHTVSSALEKLLGEPGQRQPEGTSPGGVSVARGQGGVGEALVSGSLLAASSCLLCSLVVPTLRPYSEKRCC